MPTQILGQAARAHAPYVPIPTTKALPGTCRCEVQQQTAHRRCPRSVLRHDVNIALVRAPAGAAEPPALALPPMGGRGACAPCATIWSAAVAVHSSCVICT